MSATIEIIIRYRARAKEPQAARGDEPGVPGDGMAFRKPLEEVEDGEIVLRHQPGLQVRVDEVGPAVLRGRVVEDLGEKGDQLRGQADRGNGGGDDHHRVDEDELPRRQRPLPAHQDQRGVVDQDQEKEQQDRPAGDEVAGPVEGAHGEDPVRHDDVDHQAHQGADEQGFDGNSFHRLAVRRGGGVCNGGGRGVCLPANRGMPGKLGDISGKGKWESPGAGFSGEHLY